MKTRPILIGLFVTVATNTLGADAGVFPGLARDLTRRPNALVVLTNVTDLTGARHLADAGHLVLALTDDEHVPALRQQAGPAVGKTLYIKNVSARRIPLADNYANAIVVTEGARLDEAAIAEIIRAIAPRGAAALPIASSIDAQRVRQLLPDVAGLSVTIRGEHIVIRKPKREGSDDWSYWNHSPSNNPVSGEKNISWLLQTQWLG